MLAHIALILDALLLAFAIGATIWFFFVQSPVLITWMGKEKFVPIQMKLTKVLFQSLAITLPLMLGLSFVHGYDAFWLHVATAGIAVFGALVNRFVVVPRALRAGGRSMKEVRTQAESHSVADFASRGGGEESKTWHRLVVVFVVVMLGGLFAHGAVLLGAGPAMHHETEHTAVVHDHHSTHAHVADTVEDGKRWPADAATTANVQAMSEVVKAAVSRPPAHPDDHAKLVADLQAGYQKIFEQCTMTGEAHEHLHQFLLPIGAQLTRLDTADTETAAATLAELDTHLASYAQQFE